VAATPLDRYYNSLDAGDDDAAAAAFADDAVYIVPGVAGGTEINRGRAAIRELFAQRRERQNQSPHPHRHDLRAIAVDGRRCFVEGLMVTDEGPVGVFLAHATVGDDGLINRYIAAFNETSLDFDAAPE
jgi:hypothetical protein